MHDSKDKDTKIETELNYTKTITNVQKTPGDYYVKVIVEYKANEDIPERAKATDTFTILPQGGSETPGGDGTGGGGGGGAAPETTEPTVTYKLEILDLPTKLNLTADIKPVHSDMHSPFTFTSAGAIRDGRIALIFLFP